MSWLGEFALGYGLLAAGAQGLSMMLAAPKCRRRRPLPAPAGAPQVTIVQPLCGVEPFLEATLESTFALDYPQYDLIFCVARAADPAAPFAKRAIQRHPERRARLLIGDDRASPNPKLNNVLKGWKAARGPWIVIADSNVLMPRDYIQRLMAAWKPRTGVVSAPPIGGAAASLAAEFECAFLNTYQARWQYAANACGLGFAQGKSMLWRRDILEAQGGIERLGEEIAEDAAATKLVRRAKLRPRLAAGSFPQPLGKRSWKEVWDRQARWARLRRATFPLYFTPELLTSGLLAVGATALGAWDLGWRAGPWALGVALFWYGSEAVFARWAGWRMRPATFIALVARDAALPWLWAQAWSVDAVEWRGHVISAERPKP
ncbi:MAG: glycosyltransferase [Bradyrhizobium sp.]|nr:MAG: glycosyltransferase [Bradyrhizobium sp.]